MVKKDKLSSGLKFVWSLLNEILIKYPANLRPDENFPFQPYVKVGSRIRPVRGLKLVRFRGSRVNRSRAEKDKFVSGPKFVRYRWGYKGYSLHLGAFWP